MLPLAALATLGFLYYHPITSYFQTKRELAARGAQVARLRDERAEFQVRLEQSRSLDVLAREARRVGYIRPGEQLYIIKGIKAWRRANAAAPSR